MKPLTFSFDIGYASIGWSVIEACKHEVPEVVGAGVVLFPSDDCLASQRRAYRRLRRTIRSRRARIERMGRILEHYGVISHAERFTPGAPLPYLLAARVLQGRAILSPLELWHVLRWYAHNRGYDGNSQWHSQQEEAEDSERVEIAKSCMKDKGTRTMAETICAYMNLDPADPLTKLQVNSPKYKSLQMAFPRNIVEQEVRAICEACACLPERVRALILDDVSCFREELKEAGVQLPLRYVGSVLFGQLKPRFDNRIIERCPITWAQVYKQTVEQDTQGTPEERRARAKKEADKLAKVPKADCREFYEYRYARILANIRVADKPLTAEQRLALWEVARQKRKFTKKEFIDAVESLSAGEPNNLQNYFQIEPEREKALIFHPSGKEKASGRAPYARPVLRQVVAEVLRGEDPARPARSLEHPEGEEKAADGVLYCLQDPESLVNENLSKRSIDEQTNNPLVRHRLLIFERLLGDMIKKYADGDGARVERCVVEVAREVRTFAGKDIKEIKAALGVKLKGFHDAVKYLQKHAPSLPLTAKLIKKCRIAMDMNWTCPYTGMTYQAFDLPKMELEHIIPYSARETNALSALTLTWPEVNKMKGDLTGFEFIQQFAGQPVAGIQNLSITPVDRYTKFVKSLRPKSARKDEHESDDDKRRRMRKRLLLVEKKPGKTEVGFTLGQLTQSSQLMRMAAQVAKKHVRQAKIDMIPGRITAETRKAWKLMGILAHSDIVPEICEGMDKETIRSITHLHHAIDACVLGLIPHLIPGGTNGAVWAAMLKRQISAEQANELRAQTKLFAFSKKGNMMQLHLQDIPEQVKNSISRALQEKRVVQHIPADMSGAKLNEQYQGIVKIENDIAYLKTRDKSKATESVKVSKIAGIRSEKLRRIKAALEVNDNYGIAIIGNKAEMIRHIAVYKTLARLRKENPGIPIMILKKGALIRITHDKIEAQNGIWRIRSVKDNAVGLCLDLIRPELVTLKRNDTTLKWENVRLDRCLKAGLHIINTSYIGI